MEDIKNTPDWEAIKIEYVTENISYEKLANKHKVPPSTLIKRAYRERWTQEREKYRQEVVKKIYNRMSNAEAKKYTKVDRSLQRLAELIEKSLDDEKREAYKYRVGEGANTQMVDLGVLNTEHLDRVEDLLNKVRKQMDELYGVLPLRQIRELELEAKRIEADACVGGDDETSTGGVIALPARLPEAPSGGMQNAECKMQN